MEIACQSHGKRFRAARKSGEVYIPPTYSKNRVSMLCGQLRVHLDGEEELDSLVEALNARVVQLCGGEELSPASNPNSSFRMEEDGSGEAKAWKKNNLTLMI